MAQYAAWSAPCKARGLNVATGAGLVNRAARRKTIVANGLDLKSAGQRDLATTIASQANLRAGGRSTISGLPNCVVLFSASSHAAMSIITRYVLAELVKIFFFSLLAMTSMMMVVGVVAEATRQGLGPEQVGQMLPYLLPEALRFTVPGTLLFAACSVYGRMSGSNEIVAAKSLGISPMVFLWPVLIFAFLLSLVTVWLNDVAVSWGRNGVRRVVIEAVEEIAYGMLRTQRSYATNHFSINVMDVDGRRLMRPTLTFQARDNTPAITLSAAEAELESDPAANELTIICRDSTIYVDDASYYHPGELRRTVPLDEASTRGDNSRLPSWLALHEIPREIVRTRAELDAFEQKRAAQAAFQLLHGDMTGLVGAEWQVNDAVRSDLKNRIARLFTEPHRRWANGFSCLCFVLVGAPLAIRMRNSDFLTTFFVCFLFVLIVYYPLLAYGVDLAKRGDLPPLAVWQGNVLLVAWGAWLMHRVFRY